MANFKIHIEGSGLNFDFDREVEDTVVARIMSLLLGVRASQATPIQGSGQGSGAAPVLEPLPADSPRECLDGCRAKTNRDKIAALAFYLRSDGRDFFAPKELPGLFVQAGEPRPKNLARDLKAALRAGWIARNPGDSDQYYLTKRGEEAVTSGFSQRAPRTRRAPRSPRISGSGREVNSTPQGGARPGPETSTAQGELLGQG